MIGWARPSTNKSVKPHCFVAGRRTSLCEAWERDVVTVELEVRDDQDGDCRACSRAYRLRAGAESSATFSLVLSPKVEGWDRDGRRWLPVGVGWSTRSGGVRIKLNAGVSISWRDLEDHDLYVFPSKPKEPA